VKEIQSRANPLFRDLQRQCRLAGKPNHPLWLEGPHLCQMWMTHQALPDWLIFAASSAEHPEILPLRDRIPTAQQICLADALFKSISAIPSHQGVLLVAQPPTVAAAIDWGRSAVLLDRVQDPGNVGTILRTCAAVGVTQVICSTGTAACWAPKVLRSAQGAHFVLNIHESIDLLDGLTQAKRATAPAPSIPSVPSMPILATTLEASESLYEGELPKEAIWLFGHEGQGVAPALLALADRRLRIEHAQPAIESLNVASAVAVCLFEQHRQHRK
jgi:TrmH family RNA methyltransferase